MNPYQQKWMDIFSMAHLPGWEFEAVGDTIHLTMPHVTDLKLVRDKLPGIIAQLLLDIDIPHQRLPLIIKNGYEEFEYIINP